jgi:hypothetical protein
MINGSKSFMRRILRLPQSAERTAQPLRGPADRVEAQEGLNRIFTMESEIKAKALDCVQAITQKLRAM